MLLSDAEFHEAASVEEASDLLLRFGSAARVLAGGTDLLVEVKRGRFWAGHVISLNRIAALKEIAAEDGVVRVGALTTVSQLASSPVIRRRFPAILDATRKMAGPQIRNMATVGGNLCNANHCADLPPIFLVLNAKVRLRSRARQRILPLAAFFVGPKQTALEAGEVLTDILLPDPPARFAASFSRFSLRESNAIAVAGVAAGLAFDRSGLVRSARIALSAVAPTARLVKGAGELLLGRRLDEAGISRAAAAAVDACDPITDLRGRAEFRRALVKSLTRTALIHARDRAQTNAGLA